MINKKKFWVCLVGVTLLSNNLFAQDNQADKWKIYPTIGITWRSAVTNFLGLEGVDKVGDYTLYNDERNVQGFSLNTGLQVRYGPIGFEYHPNLRYDVIYEYANPDTWEVSGVFNNGKDTVWSNSYQIEVKEFIADHNFNLTFRRRSIDYGIGMSIVNTGKGYEVINEIPKFVNSTPNESPDRYHDVQFKTYNVFVTIPIKKVVNLEIKALYIPQDFPNSPNKKYIAFSLRAYYKFNFINNWRTKKGINKS